MTRGSGATLTALVSGSVILAGKACGCVGKGLAWAWEQARTETPATRSAEGEGTGSGATAVRRPFLEAAGMFALGGVLAAGALGTVSTLVWPYVQLLAPWRGVLVTVGGLAWMVAAWMVAPPPAPSEAEDEEVDGEAGFADEHQEQGETPVEDALASRADLLARHVLGEVAELEKAGKGGVHVTALVASAETAGLLVPGSMDKAAMRQWLDASGIPVTKSVKVKGDVDYGVRVDRVREALGAVPGEPLAALLGGGAPTAPTAPAPAPGETPVTVPLPAAAEPAQARCLTLVKPLPEDGSKGSAQGVA